MSQLYKTDNKESVLGTTTTSMQQIQSRIIENFMIIWLNVQNDDFHEDSIKQIQKIINSVNIFSDTNECMNYISQLENEEIIMIISNQIENQLMAAIENIPQVNSIYFLSNKNLANKHFDKVKGIFNRIDLICNKIKQDIYIFQRDLTPISIISSTLRTDLSELDESYVCSQLIKDISLGMNYDEQVKKDLLAFARLHYAGNQYQLKIINEFECDYNRLTPVWWYTRDCFTYSMLNRALRVHDSEIIIRMGFFIRHLYEQIERIHAKMDKSQSLIVYRGQGMSNNLFEKLLKSKGGLISFNNFFSTSTDRQVSLNLAKQSATDSNLTSILFQMTINPSISSIPFASLDEISHFPKNKNQILFPLHTIFRIELIEQLENRLWKVDLTLISNQDEEFLRLTEHIRKAAGGEAGMHRLAKIMLTMGKIDKAKEIYSALLRTTVDDEKKELAHIHHQLAYIYEQKDDLVNALSHYNQSLNNYLTYLSFNDPELCPTYSNIGLILKKQGKCDSALEFLQHALDIDLIAAKSDPIEVAILYMNIGGVYDAQGKPTEALENYKNALDIVRSCFSSNHPLIEATLNSIGLIYYSMKDYSLALTHFKETLEIEEKSSIHDNPSLIMTYTNIAGVLEDLHQYKEAVEYAEKALNIVHKTLGDDHPQLIILQDYLDQLRHKQ